MVRRTGAAGAKLAASAEAAARPAAAAARGATERVARRLRDLDLRGAAAAVSQSSAAAATWAAAAVQPTIASLREAARGWYAAAAATATPRLSSLSARLHEGWCRARAASQRFAARTCERARTAYAAVDPTGRLPAALRRGGSPCGATILLLGLGGASLAFSVALVLSFATGAHQAAAPAA